MARNGYARTFGQDLMRGEHVVGQTGMKPGRKHTASLKGGLTLRTTTDPYKEEKRLHSASLKGCTTFNLSTGAYGNCGHSDEMNTAASSGTSIFDPVLCELAYRWFCPPGGAVLDPFAGGSVRGIVASKLGRPYVGIDLRPEQIEANREQAERICDAPMPVWHVGDSLDILPGLDVEADFVFSCPPYADLEVYSDDPRDLSTMAYDEFRVVYEEIIVAACAKLREDRFACFVVGDVRDSKGLYRGFPWHTVAAFEAAGLRLYNEAVLVTAAGSLPIRVGKQFEASRKPGKTHQNVLVFVKGDPRRATEAIGPVEFGEIAEDDDGDHFEVVSV